MDKIVEAIGSLGYTEIDLKGDGEPALIQVMEAVEGRRSHATRIHPPRLWSPE